MKGSRIIRPLQVRTTAKMILLAFLASLLVAFSLLSQAYASPYPCVYAAVDSWAGSSGATPTMVFQADTEDVAGNYSPVDTAGSESRSSKVSGFNAYESVRGYSAFNHFSTALKAMIAAAIVVLGCFASFYVYRRHRDSQEKALSKSGMSTAASLSDDQEFVREDNRLR